MSIVIFFYWRMTPTYDTDNDGILTLENFLTFYTEACNQRSYTVWNNLHFQNYRNDLRLNFEVEEETELDVNLLIRYQISQEERYFQLLFQLLEHDNVALLVWPILNRIPTSLKIQNEILLH